MHNYSATRRVLLARGSLAKVFQHFALLLLLLAAGFADAEDLELNDALRASEENYSPVIQGMPRHPKSAEVLEHFVNQFDSQGETNRTDILLRIARAFSDSNLGLFALSSGFGSVPPEPEWVGPLETLIYAQPSSRVAKMAFDILARAAGDISPLVREVRESCPDTEVAAFAMQRMAEQNWEAGQQRTALVQFLEAAIEQLHENPEGTGAAAGNLDSRLLESGLVVYAAALQCVAPESAPQQRFALTRIQNSIIDMGAEKEPDSGPLEALWKSRMNTSQLETIAVGADSPMLRRQARLQLAARELSNGRILASLQSLTHYKEACLQEHQRSTDTLSQLLDAFYLLAAQKQSYASLGAAKEVSECLTYYKVALQSTLERLEWHALSDEEETLVLMVTSAFQLEHSVEEANELLRRLAKTCEGERRGAYLLRAGDSAFVSQAYIKAARDFLGAADAFGDAAEAEEAHMRAAHALYMAETFEECVRLLSSLSATRLSQAKSAEASYLLALSQFRAGDCKSALQQLKPLVDATEQPDWTRKAKLLTLYIHAANFDQESGIQESKEFLNRYSDVAGAKPAKRIQESLIRWNSPLRTGETGENRPKYIVLISLDTTRADRLGCYGNTEARTPNLDALAARGTVFLNAMSTTSWTKPSHASVFTGVYPPVHAVQGYYANLGTRLPVLAETMSQVGYETVGVVSARWLHSEFGFARGFNFYDDFTFDLDRNHNLFLRCADAVAVGEDPHLFGYTSSIVTDAALQHFEAAKERKAPVFLFLNFYDPHHYYTPPVELLQERAGFSSYSGREKLHAGLPVEFRTMKTAADVEQVFALYDGEIAYMDSQIGRLVTYLRQTGDFDNTLFIVFGDHGEEFLEHGGSTHQKTLYNEVLHVPLILSGPGVTSGRRIPDVVSLVDIYPTLAALLKIPLHEVQGKDILSNSEQTLGERPVFAELNRGGILLKSVIQGHNKLILDSGAGTSELYNLKGDPGESIDRSDDDLELKKALEHLLQEYDSENQKLLGVLDTGADEDTQSVMDQESLEILRTLGYL